MDLSFEPLEELVIDVNGKHNDLPRLWSSFRIPRLIDKPQNPIIGNLENKRKPLLSAPLELVTIPHVPAEEDSEEPDIDIWTRLILDPDLGEYKVNSDLHLDMEPQLTAARIGS